MKLKQALVASIAPRVQEGAQLGPSNSVVRALFIVAVCTAIVTFGLSPNAQSQTLGYSASSNKGTQVQRTAQTLQPQIVVGGIFSAQLRVPVALVGWEELFGGCPDGETGQWVVDNIPSYGRMSTRLVDAGTRPGCDRPDIYNTLYYTMVAPIPGWGISASDPVKAHWQSVHVGPQYGDWQAAYLMTSRTRDYFAAPVSTPTVTTTYPPSNVVFRLVSQISFEVGKATTSDKLTLWRIAQDQVVAKQVIARRGSEWKVLGQRDFDGDSKSDILWGNGKGQLQIWFMDGFSVKSKTAKVNIGNRSSDWTILGNDNRGDILWRNTAGDVELWQVSGADPSTIKVKKNIVLDNIPTSWKFSGFGDFQGKGYIDILWHDPITGATAIWVLGKNEIAEVEDCANRGLQGGDYIVDKPIVCG